ncbi:hypothetical protein QCA50_007795 [Cerrena zonata]|uniref:AB hydrolase-1 domain-containing protein n=1 Tax=Cerrena zonata TaxID=2478898 RepID=A0AAW0GCN2_9APHY
MTFLSQRHVITCKGVTGRSLNTVVVRYTRNERPSSSGTILVLAHAVGCHKEQWLPILERLWAIPGLDISEAWSVEGPNHGDALAYNKELLDEAFNALSDLSGYGQVLLGFINSGLLDYKHREVIAIVHSAGCQAAVHAASAFIRDGKTVPFTSIILLEPVFLSADVSNALLSRLVKPCAARKWQWKSREEAAQHVKKAFPWKSWHTDAAEVFLEYGMVHTFEGSQLKLPSHVEAACYPNTEAQVAGLMNLPSLCEAVPVHILFGARYDLVPKKIRDPFIASFRDKLTSLRWVEEAGHMLPQENPDGCVEALSAILRENAQGPEQRPKL